MHLRIEELALPKYLSRDTAPDVIAALDMYSEVLPEDLGHSLQSRRALTIYKFCDSVPYIARDELSGAAVAVANFNPWYRLKGSSFLEAFVVHPSAREHGVGRFVVGELVRITHEQGLERMRLRSLEAAIGFYAHLGFVCDEIVPVDAAEPYMSIDVSVGLSPAAELSISA